jgi:hypothetical protein
MDLPYHPSVHNKLKVKFTILLISLLILTTFSSIPTIIPENTLLNSQSNYIINYFALKQLQTTCYFQIDFSQSDVLVPTGTLNVTATYNGTAITQSSITSSCTSSKVCTIKLGTAGSANTNVAITFGMLTNPKYTASQPVNFFIYMGPNSNDT